MKVVKKAVICVLAAVMMAGSAVTVLAAEPLQAPSESSQSVTQQDGQTAEKKARKSKITTDDENGTKTSNGRFHKKGMTPADGSDDVTGETRKRPEKIKSDTAEENSDDTAEIKRPKRHGKHKSTDDVQTSEDGTEASKRRLNKKDKSTADENTEETANT